MNRFLLVSTTAVALLAYGCNNSSTTGQGAANPSQGTPSVGPQQSKLREYAIRDLHESKFSTANTKTGLCDKLLDEAYDFSFGVASPETMGGARALPAVVVRHHFTCVINATAQKERNEQWAILALDEEFETLRCIRTGPPAMIVDLYQECKFKPTDGKLPFPPPEQIEELWRPAYAKALEKLIPAKSAAVAPGSSQTITNADGGDTPRANVAATQAKTPSCEEQFFTWARLKQMSSTCDIGDARVALLHQYLQNIRQYCSNSLTESKRNAIVEEVLVELKALFANHKKHSRSEAEALSEWCTSTNNLVDGLAKRN